jgi:hypothetical protein
MGKRKKDEWNPLFVLPNVSLSAAIGCSIATLAPPDDPRVAALKRTHPRLRQFLSRFSDNFGEKFEPSVLLVHSEAPRAFLDITALASFRDLIAIATVTYNRALELLHPRGHRVLFGEAFAIYPWMIDKNYEDVIGSTPAILGTHEVAKLKGQSSPALFRASLDAVDLDQPLLANLLDRWQRRYGTGQPQWGEIALFRSLNMAYHASLLPAATDTTFYDVGRLVSLWVSAFEILVHPGGNGQANRDKVFELLEKTPWELRATANRIYETGGKTKVNRTLASWLYQTLYECRNNFLHGNPVERAALLLITSNRSVFEYAAPLYRLALTAFLPLTYAAPRPPLSAARAFGAYVAKHNEFMDQRRVAEEAILTAKQSPHQRSARHRQRPGP